MTSQLCNTKFLMMTGAVLLLVMSLVQCIPAPDRSTRQSSEPQDLLTEFKNKTSMLNSDVKSNLGKKLNSSIDFGKQTDAISELCHFYDTLEEYRQITGNDTDIRTRAINAVLTEVYHDSCHWLKSTGIKNFTNCSSISQPDVVELCALATLNTVASDLLSDINKAAAITSSTN